MASSSASEEVLATNMVQTFLSAHGDTVVCIHDAMHSIPAMFTTHSIAAMFADPDVDKPGSCFLLGDGRGPSCLSISSSSQLALGFLQPPHVEIWDISSPTNCTRVFTAQMPNRVDAIFFAGPLLTTDHILRPARMWMVGALDLKPFASQEDFASPITYQQGVHSDDEDEDEESRWGCMRMSADGQRMAICSKAGLELWSVPRLE